MDRTPVSIALLLTNLRDLTWIAREGRISHHYWFLTYAVEVNIYSTRTRLTRTSMMKNEQ